MRPLSPTQFRTIMRVERTRKEFFFYDRCREFNAEYTSNLNLEFFPDPSSFRTPELYRNIELIMVLSR